MQPGKANSVGALIEAAVRGELTRASALRLCADILEVIALALPAAAKRIAEQNTRITKLEGNGRGAQPAPSTPSGMVPVYTKPNPPERHKTPGARMGHQGVRRQRPVRIDECATHRLKNCPHCQGERQRCPRYTLCLHCRDARSAHVRRSDSPCRSRRRPAAPPRRPFRWTPGACPCRRFTRTRLPHCREVPSPRRSGPSLVRCRCLAPSFHCLPRHLPRQPHRPR